MSVSGTPEEILVVCFSVIGIPGDNDLSQPENFLLIFLSPVLVVLAICACVYSNAHEGSLVSAG